MLLCCCVVCSVGSVSVLMSWLKEVANFVINQRKLLVVGIWWVLLGYLPEQAWRTRDQFRYFYFVWLALVTNLKHFCQSFSVASFEPWLHAHTYIDSSFFDGNSCNHCNFRGDFGYLLCSIPAWLNWQREQNYWCCRKISASCCRRCHRLHCVMWTACLSHVLVACEDLLALSVSE